MGSYKNRETHILNVYFFLSPCTWNIGDTIRSALFSLLAFYEQWEIWYASHER